MVTPYGEWEFLGRYPSDPRYGRFIDPNINQVVLLLMEPPTKRRTESQGRYSK